MAMLEHLPVWLGQLLRTVRAGHSKLVIVQLELAVNESQRIDLSSPAFATGARMPARFTADGAGVSPPLVWGKLPDGVKSLALIVEDPDAPALNPFVHAIVWNMPASEHTLSEGAITAGYEEDGRDVGRNSLLSEGWLPPDPPPGHGSHDYVFQLFALAETPQLGDNPGRDAVLHAMAGHVLAAGLLVGTYSRGDATTIVEDEAAKRRMAT